MCKNKLKISRYFLPLLFLPALFIVNEIRNNIYVPIIIFISSFVFFWNFQYFVYYTASKPLYYEDLFIDEKKLPNYNVDKKIKEKFELILKWVLIISNALLVSALSEFWMYKVQELNSYIEIIGITGGIVKIFQIVNNTITRIMLKTLRKFIKIENKHQHEIELNQINMKRTRSGTI
tara:strand:- start:5908 stop:6438 length:531 start_codon:yes stop_codon:yes gene_type:complete